MWTAEGWSYLAVVIDLCARRVVGWAMADHMRTELPLLALTRALEARRPCAGLIHHSDRGSQYASTTYRSKLRDHEVAQARAAPATAATTPPSRASSPRSRRCIHRRHFATRTGRTPRWPTTIDNFLQPSASTLDQQLPQPHAR
ncbi:MAG: DDE-type integrase/transposase/recombinase [Sandaracinaceae bacterium]|nr:DDE-type integrase/transposase/recombinase [Sandaracinaceae bacterium]